MGPYPEISDLPKIEVKFCYRVPDFMPLFRRDPETLARPIAISRHAGLEHRIGGIEKQAHHRQRELRSGKTSSDGEVRQEKNRSGRERHTACRSVWGKTGKVLVLGWVQLMAH